jgi:hypothetical protein
MILGHHQTTSVALEDGVGFSVKSTNDAVVVTEIKDPRDLIAMRNDYHNALMQPGVDEKLRNGLMPDIVMGAGPRYFNVFGRGLVGPPAVTIVAKSPKSNKDDTSLRVVVLKDKHIKLGIRNLKVPDGNGAMVEHATKPSAPEKDVAAINAIWTPQANIIFDLVNKDPLFLDDTDEKTQQELAKALGTTPGYVPKIGEIVDPNKLVNMIASRNKTEADFTIIVVRKAVDLAKSVVNGITIPAGRFAMVTDLRDMTTMAHEAGHFIGGHGGQAGWVDEPDWWGADSRMLMRGGGAGFKIPFDFAIQCRKFPASA